MTDWRTADANELRRQLRAFEDSMLARVARLEGGRAWAGENPSILAPGEDCLVRTAASAEMSLRAPTVDEIGRIATVVKADDDYPLHVAAAGSRMDGVRDGRASIQRAGVSRFLVARGSSGGAEWSWLDPTSQIFGSYYISTAVATTIAVASTWYHVFGLTTLVDGDLMSMYGYNRMQLDAYGDHELSVTAACSASSAAPNQTMQAAFAINDTVQTQTIIERRMGTVDVGAFALTAALKLSRGDYLSVQIRNTTAANNITMDYMTVQASEAI